MRLPASGLLHLKPLSLRLNCAPLKVALSHHVLRLWWSRIIFDAEGSLALGSFYPLRGKKKHAHVGRQR